MCITNFLSAAGVLFVCSTAVAVRPGEPHDDLATGVVAAPGMVVPVWQTEDGEPRRYTSDAAGRGENMQRIDLETTCVLFSGCWQLEAPRRRRIPSVPIGRS